MNESNSIRKYNLLDFTQNEIRKYIAKIGESSYRGSQIFKWLYNGAENLDDMGNIPKNLREKLSETAYIGYLDVLDMQVSKSDETVKFLFGLNDESAIESVFMKYKYGNSICISSQAGCRMGCKFCASGINGLSRNLTAGEMIGQILTAERYVREYVKTKTEGQQDVIKEQYAASKKQFNKVRNQYSYRMSNDSSSNKNDWEINHIVIMGTGEPFDNYENVSKFINIVHDTEGLNLSMRNMTVSTSGIIPGIEKFSEDFPQVNLAISLHAATDELRSSMMPINNKYPIADLINAAKEYTEKTGRRITFEYTMVNGVNDSDSDADRLANLIQSMLCHVNIIPLNRVDETGFDPVSRKRAEEFAGLLKKKHIPVTVRRELGTDIDAACGQLRLKKTAE